VGHLAHFWFNHAVGINVDKSVGSAIDFGASFALKNRTTVVMCKLGCHGWRMAAFHTSSPSIMSDKFLRRGHGCLLCISPL
jgi:hypothetical protein